MSCRRIGNGIWVVVALTVFWAGEPAFSKGYEVKKKTAEYEVTARLDRNPPILGDNPIEIEIQDPSGKQVREATVLINYYMPPMPRMAPMNYTIEAKVSGNRYKARINFIMTGPWIIVIKMKREGKTSTTKFNVDVH